ncbi:MAG: glycosyltransferase family 9 protein [Nitrospiraceae bacterium]|nr:glycosyltransferase family 9 protein [Nitrospiraceae bacterium]
MQNDYYALLCLNNLGDGVMIAACITALADHMPRKQWVLVAKPSVCELYKHDKRIAAFIPYTCSWFPGVSGVSDGMHGFWRTVGRLRAFKCAAALNTVSDTRSNLLVRLAGIKKLISAYGRHGHWLSSDVVGYEIRYQHEVERHLEMAARLVGQPLAPLHLDIRISLEDEQSADILIHEMGDDNSLIAAIHPGANVDFKEWPLNHFAAVGRFLVQEKKCKVLVLGAPGREEGLAAELIGKIGSGAYNLAGKTPVRTLLALLKRCALYIGNDSGPTHLAAAAACPTVAIFGATNPYRFGPYLAEDSKRIIRSPLFNFDAIGKARESGKGMLDAVTVEMVTTAIDELWEKVTERHALKEAR